MGKEPAPGRRPAAAKPWGSQRSPVRALPRIVTVGILQVAKLSVLCLVFLLTSSVLSAATWCLIDVEVRDGGTKAVEGVDVHAVSSVVFEARRQMTGPDGTAVLLGLPAGSYRLEISREGYQWLEVQDVRCKPGGVVRLAVTLERTDGDEVVVLPSGPSVDPEATTIGYLRPREAWELLPEAGLRGAGLWLADAIAFEGILRAGLFDDPGPQVVVVPRSPETDFHGRVSIDVGGGLQARPTGTRGDVTALDAGVRARVSLGTKPADGHFGTFLALETNVLNLESRVAFDDRISGETLQRRNQWDQDSVLAYGVLDWMAAPDNRLELRVNWGRRRQQDAPSSLHVAPDSPVPRGKENSLDRAVGLQWHALVSDHLAVSLIGRFSDRSREWTPTESGPMEQDQSPDGLWSAGLGNGIWAGDGGVAAFDQSVDDLQGEAGLEWSVGSAHRLGIEASSSREDLDFTYSEVANGVGVGVRRTYRGSVAQRWDMLANPAVSRGRLESRRIDLRDSWRAAPKLTVVFGLQMEDLDFDTGGNSPGYDFGFEDTLSPHVGLVWDFEGTGRSRAWVRWARFRQGPGEAVRLRMTGALDVETIFVDTEGALAERSPGPLSVASDLEPSSIDETVVGVEYELLSHLVAGAAGTFRRSQGNLAILTEDGGSTFELGTPSGDAWPERLDSEVLETWAWLRKRLANGWQAEMLVGWRRSRGAWPGSPDLDPTDLDREFLADVLSPAALEGAWGPLPDDRRWHLQVAGSWLFAAGPSLGGRVTYRSGAPVSRLGALADGLGLDRRFIDSRGSGGRTPELWRMDLVGSWPFDLGKGRLEVFAELKNLLDSQRAVRLDERWTVLDEAQIDGLDPDEQRTAGTWREPLIVQRPLEVRVGVAYRW